MSTAVVFPGMGPNRFADAAKFMMVNPSARRLLAAASDAVGYSVMNRFRDSEDDYSEAAQVAFFVNCVALAEWARERYGLEPALCAGPSFGQKALTAFTGALPFEDAARLTALLARRTEEYFATEHRDLVTLSFVRAPWDALAPLLEELTERGEWHDFSCYLDDGFYMLTLRAQAVEEFERRIRSIGGLPLYTMRPPMHSSLFSGLRKKVADEVLGEFRFNDPEIPVVADSDGSVVRTGDGIRDMLLDGYVTAVRWPSVVATFKELGVTKVCVAGPDKLFGRVDCTVSNFEVLAADPVRAMRPRT
ncbi:ACP S-malonyltransferase [Streptomyces albireticuli]|uniref:[acyl-carrier-protein] S-malonyltransferase n=2 Tax=Streptomyces albireticuli TaxID=1940 RepID=A0A2A2D433_9ACTN|nr:ACP S-malonyltransferase [Streptomyces albireticuli]